MDVTGGAQETNMGGPKMGLQTPAIPIQSDPKNRGLSVSEIKSRGMSMSTDLISRPTNNETSRSPSINNSANTVGQQRRFDEDVNLPLIKVVVLGAPAVGKTSVVKVRKSCTHITIIVQ